MIQYIVLLYYYLYTVCVGSVALILSVIPDQTHILSLVGTSLTHSKHNNLFDTFIITSVLIYHVHETLIEHATAKKM